MTTAKTTTKTVEKPVAADQTPPTESVLPTTVEHTPEEVKEIRVIERIIESKEIAPVDAFGRLSRPQIELLKRTIAKGASDDELTMFIQVCKGANLNPFLKQVHLVPRWDSKEGKEVRAIQVGIDGFRAVAESSGQYAGNDDPIYDGEKDITYTKYENKKPVEAILTVPIKATVTVYKIVEGGRYGFTATARWDEYYPGAKMGFQWHVRPYLMLGKCAEALALRKAFPKLLSGMYEQAELERTSAADDPAKKQQAGFQTLLNAIGTATLDQLHDYKTKMEKSDKYSPEQKAEYSKAVNARLAELEQTPA